MNANLETPSTQASSLDSQLLVLCGLVLMLLALSAQSAGASQWTEDTPVWATTLKIGTCYHKKSGTDSPIWARLNSQWTRLNRGLDDFDKRRMSPSGNGYALQTSDVQTVADIRRIEIFNGGRDALCVSAIELWVNGSLMFRRNGSFWISQGDGMPHTYKISAAELRSDTEYWTQSPAMTFFRLAGLGATVAHPHGAYHGASLDLIIETSMGHALSDNGKVCWGHRYGRAHVEVSVPGTHPPEGTSWWTSDTVTVDLDLGSDGAGGKCKSTKRRSVDADFDLTVSCVTDPADPARNYLSLEASNIRIASHSLGGYISDTIHDIVDELSGRLARSLDVVNCDDLNPHFIVVKTGRRARDRYILLDFGTPGPQATGSTGVIPGVPGR